MAQNRHVSVSSLHPNFMGPARPLVFKRLLLLDCILAQKVPKHRMPLALPDHIQNDYDQIELRFNRYTLPIVLKHNLQHNVEYFCNIFCHIAILIIQSLPLKMNIQRVRPNG